MDPVLIILLSCVVLGLIVGTLAGMLGIGGGLLIVPALVFLLTHFLNMDPAHAMPVAVATSLSTIIFTGFSSARAHHKLGNLNRHIIVWCGLGIAIGATIGAQVASWMPGDILKQVFAVLVAVLAAHMIFGKRKASQHTANQGTLIVIGVVVGILSAIMGIGGGALLVPALVWFQINMRQAIGCAALSGLVIALFGSASFVYAGWSLTHLPPYSLGYVYLPATLGIVTTSVFTAGMGARLGQRMNTDLLKKVLAGLLVLISIRMVIGME